MVLKNRQFKPLTLYVLFLGRKEPLELIRKAFLRKHKKYMRLKHDDFYASITREQLAKELERINEKINCSKMDMQQSITYLKRLNRQRHISFWHDGSTVSNHSHLLMMVSCLYDTAIYLTDSEYLKQCGKIINQNHFYFHSVFTLMATMLLL